MSEAILGRGRRRRSARTSPSARFLVWSAIVLGVGALIYAVTTTVLLPYTRIDRVAVQADFEIDRATLLELAGLTGSISFFDVDPELVRTRLESVPQIKRAVVERVFPDTVRLTMERRRPLLVTLLSIDGVSVPAAIDEDGVIFDRGALLADLDLPVISGLAYQGDVLGSKLPEVLSEPIATLYALRVEEPKLFEALSEVRIDPRTAGGVDLLMYTEASRIPVRMGGDLTVDAFAYALIILDVLAQQGTDRSVQELDFRSGEIVYRLKEEQSAR